MFALDLGEKAHTTHLTHVSAQIMVRKSKMSPQLGELFIFFCRDARICDSVTQSTAVERKAYHAHFRFGEVALFAYGLELAGFIFGQDAIGQCALERFLIQTAAM